jgi:anti-sigma-K factor RskA
MNKPQDMLRKEKELLEKDRKLREKDEPSPPMAQRKGLWRILAASAVLAVIALAIAWAVIGATAG